MTFSTTKQHTSNIRAAHYFHLVGKNNDEVTRITIGCDECSTYWQYKKHTKENSATIICDILKIASILQDIQSWSCPCSPLTTTQW